MPPNRKERRAFRYGRRIQREAERHWKNPDRAKHPAARTIAAYWQGVAISEIDQRLLSYAI